MAEIEQRIRHTLNDQVGSQDGHAADTDTSLSGSIGSTEASEDDSRGAAQGAEEGLFSQSSVICSHIT